MDVLEQTKQLFQKWHIVPEERTNKLKSTVLGGGVSNLVVKIECPPSEEWVLKKALGKLRVNEDWFADQSRIFRETACLNAISKYVGPEYVPRVYFEDRENFACLLECAPKNTVTWKEELLRGKFDHLVFEKVSSLLANFHRNTQNIEALERQFGDITNFLQLRISPYVEAISRRHTDLEPQLGEVIAGLVTQKLCLVHGDMSPKNILLLPDRRVWIIDCEVAHYGNPAFDIAFCMNHLILKSLHLNSLTLLDRAGNFWDEYWKRSCWSRQKAFSVRVLAALMLARIDGKSPVEYLDESKRILVRKLARNLIEKREDSFERLSSSVACEIH